MIEVDLLESSASTSEAALLHALLIHGDRGSLQARRSWRALTGAEREHVVDVVHRVQYGLLEYERGEVPGLLPDGQDPIERMRATYLIGQHGVEMSELSRPSKRGYERRLSVAERYPRERVEHILAAMASAGVHGPICDLAMRKRVRECLLATHPDVYDEQRDPNCDEVSTYAWMAHTLCPARLHQTHEQRMHGRSSIPEILARPRAIGG